MAIGTVGTIAGGAKVAETIGIPGVGNALGGVTDAIGGIFGGVDRGEGRGGETKLKSIAAPLQNGKVALDGPMTVQLEYYGAAADRDDASRRAEIFDQASRYASSGNDSGRIHNEVTVNGTQNLASLAQYLSAQNDVIGWIMQGASNLRPVKQQTSQPGGGQPGGGQNRGGQPGGGQNRGGQSAGVGGSSNQSSGFSLNAQSILLIGAAGFAIRQLVK